MLGSFGTVDFLRISASPPFFSKSVDNIAEAMRMSSNVLLSIVGIWVRRIPGTVYSMGMALEV